VNTRYTRFVIPATLAALALSTLCARADEQTSVEAQDLSIAVQASKPVYVLGEPIHLRVTLTNRSATVIRLPRQTGFEYGSLRLDASEDGQTYRKYLGPGWGLRDSIGGAPYVLEPGASASWDATVLFNHAPRTGHLAPMYAERIHREHLPPGFAFPSGGRYSLKVTLALGGSSAKTESAPLSLRLVEPWGADRFIWSVISADPSYAYLIQTGSAPSSMSDADERAALATLAQLVERYPGSAYAPPILGSLARYAASVASTPPAPRDQ
jgi:hypothetical protein